MPIPFLSSPTEDFIELLDTKCRLRRIGQSLNHYFVSFALRKDHSLLQPLTAAMRKLIDEGSVSKILRDYPQLSGICGGRGKEPSTSTQHQLSAFEFQGLFLLVGLMLFLALMRAICKRFCNRRGDGYVHTLD